MDRNSEYRDKAKVLKEIQSIKKGKYHKIGTIQTIISVVISSLITFIGFSGNQKISDYIFMIFKSRIDLNTVDMLFNIIIFILFVNVILEMVFTITKKESDSDKAIIQLASFINEIDDVENKIYNGNNQYDDIIREKYGLLQRVIPSNSAYEYKKAKRLLNKKTMFTNASMVYREKELLKKLINIIRSDKRLMEILRVMEKTSNKLYLTGGQIRNTIWDNLSNFKSDYSADDVDIIYFDKTGTDIEQEIINKLKIKNNNYKWTVKNQSNMHIHNDDNEYVSLESALLAFPDSASAIAIRKTGLAFDIICPYGLRDIFNMYVIPTDHIIKTGKIGRYRERIKNKNWSERWPLLKIINI